MMKFIIKIVFVIILASCSKTNNYDCKPKELEDYSSNLVNEYNEIRRSNSFISDTSSVQSALEKLNILLERDSTFIPALKYSSELYCMNSSIDKAIINSKKAYELDQCDIYNLPYLSFLHSLNGNEDSAKVYLDKALSAFKARCLDGCKIEDESNLLFLKLYSGKITIKAYQEKVNILGDGEVAYLADVFKDFKKEKFLENLCSLQ
ncbi:tetratricopeptide repeat protein [Gracilimonas sp.]|uniref:tetratricopeptide repeat protein n=1 Tax=Gracilimonas sp. TaxID=1974203 RepID=UPI003BAC573E